MKLLSLSALLLAGSSVHALPGPLYNETVLCQNGACDERNAQYEKIIPSQPGVQWMDAGGYCGSWSVQRASLAKGAWISQQQVRDATSPGGGHDNEILSTNIDEALKNLKLDAEGFDYKNTPTPQQKPFAQWLKKQLVAGNAVAWMIMWSGQSYPIYGLTPPAGMYGHVEPVIGIQSNHPLNDTTVYDDDVVLHFNDDGTQTMHRPLTSMGGKWAGPGSPAECGSYSYCMCTYAYGWAIKGFAGDSTNARMEASLKVQPWEKEPDTRSGEAPEALQGTLTVVDLTAGSTYDIYRWDSKSDAFTYTDSFKKTSFKASKDTYQYVDDKSFPSDGTTYYACVPGA